MKKKIGLLGGMSWESTQEYYRIINEETRERLGGDHSAELIIYSFDFYDIVRLQHEGEWDKLEEMLIEAGKSLKEGGADFLVICANTMHKMADEIEEKVGLPVIHIGDSLAEEIKSKRLKRVGLIGTKFVMDGDFYKERLKDKHGIDVIIPEKGNKEDIHDIIYNELCRGDVKESSLKKLFEVVDGLIDKGAEGIVLGCTEIPLYIKQEDVDVPIFDTTTIHALSAVDYSLEN